MEKRIKSDVHVGIGGGVLFGVYNVWLSVMYLQDWGSEYNCVLYLPSSSTLSTE